MKVTQHAQARTHQRGIPTLMIDLLEQFGTKEKTGDGAVTLSNRLLSIGNSKRKS